MNEELLLPAATSAQALSQRADERVFRRKGIHCVRLLRYNLPTIAENEPATITVHGYHPVDRVASVSLLVGDSRINNKLAYFLTQAIQKLERE
jgi:hypothetical protein